MIGTTNSWPRTTTRRALLQGAGGVGAAAALAPLAFGSTSARAASSEAYDGGYSGVPMYAGGPGNSRILGRVSWRFRCEHSGFVNGLRWWNRMGTGYSSGNGGKLLIEIRDNNAGLPGTSVLARSAVIGSPLSIGQWAQTPLSALSPLEFDTVYHITFTNTDPNGGFTSVNNLHCQAPPPIWPVYPFGAADLATMRSASSLWTNKAWTQQPFYKPIFDLRYTDGVCKGQGWIAGGRNYQNPVGGARRAQQTVIVPAGRRIEAVQFCLYHRGSGGSGVTVQVLSGATVLANATVPAAEFAYSSFGDKAVLNWVTVPVGATATAGSCTVRFSSNGEYWAMPIKNGKHYGFVEDKLLTPSLGCQYSTNSGASWAKWPAGSAGGAYYNLPVLVRYT